jgi:hypothetical protein
MTAQVVDVTGRSLSNAANRSKTTAFCVFCVLYSAERSESTAQLVSHSRRAVENDRFKQNFYLSL